MAIGPSDRRMWPYAPSVTAPPLSPMRTGTRASASGSSTTRPSYDVTT